MSKPKVYYAHSMRLYGSKREAEALKFLRTWDWAEIVDPNKDMPEEEYSEMEQYLEMVATCRMVVCSEYKRHIGKGVYQEVELALQKRLPVMLLRKVPKGWHLIAVRGVETVDETDWVVKYGKLRLF